MHFVGVGGFSMSGLAAALARLGVVVSGSDVAASPRTARLLAAGGVVRIGHDPAVVRALPGGTVVVFSTDVPADNPEVAAARARGLTVVHRSAVLEWFLHGGHLRAFPGAGTPPAAVGVRAVAITGTHGKTTTTALTGLGLLAGGCDPTVFVGADVPGLEGGNYRLGRGPAVVAEADESDGSFVRYRPDIAVVTGLEPEHLEHYGGDFACVRRAYASFVRGVAAAGLAVLCADAPELRRLDLGAGGPEVLWYGLGPGADLTAVAIEAGRESAFTVRLRGADVVRLRLGMPGRHNICNALAAVAVALRLGVEPEALGPVLADFRGPARRFEVVARVDGITVVDDYAHNPTKVAAALAAARLLAPRRLIAVFQPHRYQRTRQLWQGFATAFRAADLVLVADLYAPAGERPLTGVSSDALAAAIAAGSGVPVERVGTAQDAAERCAAAARPGDLFLVLGAGDITVAARALGERLRGRAAGDSGVPADAGEGSGDRAPGRA